MDHDHPLQRHIMAELVTYFKEPGTKTMNRFPLKNCHSNTFSLGLTIDLHGHMPCSLPQIFYTNTKA